MTQCPVRAVPAGPLRLKDLADPSGRHRVTVHSHITVQMSGQQVRVEVQRLREARRRIRGEGDGPSGTSDGA